MQSVARIGRHFRHDSALSNTTSANHYLRMLPSVKSTPKHLRHPLTSKRQHSNRPYVGLPSYETISRRFASHPNPVQFFSRKWTKDSGEIVDIHSVDNDDPHGYDVLIPDINQKILANELSEVADVKYHSVATEKDANEVVDVGKGFVFGRNSRLMFPCVVTYRGISRWVFFLADAGAPRTYLSTEVSIIPHYF